MDEVQLVATDLDRTLLLEGGKMPPDLWDYVARLNQSGILFVPASGRPLATLRDMFARPGYDVALISDNGAVVDYGGEVIYQSVMDADQYLPMVDFTLSRTTGIPVLCGSRRAYTVPSAKDHVEVLQIFYRDLVVTEDFTSIGEEIVKVSAYFEKQDARQAFDDYYRDAFESNFSVTLGGPPWVDLMNKGITKGSAIEILGEHLGLGPEQMMAFGDGLNDLEMLSTVGHGYAVENAVPELLAEIDNVTATNEELGVYQTLDELLSRR